MSDRAGPSRVVLIAALVAALLAFGMLVGGISVWLREASAPDDVWGKDLINTVPIAHDINEPRVPEDEAAKIAIAEIKKREGWTGFVETVDREGFRWYITVWPKPRPHPASIESSRHLTISGSTGEVLNYWVPPKDPVPNRK
jgi:hypothetical protein